MKNNKMHSFNGESEDGDSVTDDMAVSTLFSYIIILEILGCVLLKVKELKDNLNKNI